MSLSLNIAEVNQLSVSSVVTERWVPASCGELAQGMIDGQDFLVSAPIDLYAKVCVSLNNTGRINVSDQENYRKLVAAVSEIIGASKQPYLGADIRILSEIPRGKGMASSTAEIAAAISATYDLLGEYCDPDVISRVLIQVDRSTDALYYPGIVRVDHLKGKIIEFLGRPPSLGFIVIDQGGEVSTMNFDREKARFVARQNENLLRQALYLVRKGFSKDRASLIAKGATISSIVNQNVLNKPLFDRLLPKIKEWGALGINCAHTGTVLGVMFDPKKVPPEYLVRKIQAELDGEVILGYFNLKGGENRRVRATH